MLCHAFDGWGCLRVEFKTSALNERSRAAIARIGAQQEGILRRHMLNYDGLVAGLGLFLRHRRRIAHQAPARDVSDLRLTAHTPERILYAWSHA